mmetsp:Transcript_37012/g.56755  ORF Transcript_37012/g.56755 Transcript_37012/m.56755 type:complete len:125 (+) Transcript_37012:2376-2750(+)
MADYTQTSEVFRPSYDPSMNNTPLGGEGRVRLPRPMSEVGSRRKIPGAAVEQKYINVRELIKRKIRGEESHSDHRNPELKAIGGEISRNQSAMITAEMKGSQYNDADSMVEATGVKDREKYSNS